MKIGNSRLDSVCIRSTGSYVPSRILTNEEIVKDVPTTAEWVVENLGIRERRVAAPDEFTSDLAARAGLAALAAAGREPNDMDLIVLATSTPDRQVPSCACMAQAKMGIRSGCPAFDVSAVCSGFLYAITVAGQFIQNGVYDRVLVIGADTYSKITNWSHRHCVFFGDGSGAVVLERDRRSDGLFSSILFADGDGMDDFTIFPDDSYFSMNGRAVYEKATAALPECIRQILCMNRMEIDEVSMILPHQASAHVLQRVAENLHVPYSRMQTNLEHYANTAGATVPLLLDQVNRRGLIHKNDVLLFASIGAGWTWGATLYRW